MKRCTQYDSPAAPGETLVRCGACRQVCYCGRQCQQAHWSSHKAPCLQPRSKMGARAPKKPPPCGGEGSEGPPAAASRTGEGPTDGPFGCFKG
jgi:hypothetical protein